jgi:uncharacterized protein (TIGR03086 family)
MDLATLHRRTVETWTKHVDAVRPDQWDQPTPCTDWDVRALVNHVVGEDRWTVPLMRGATIAEVGTTLDGDLLGAQPVQAANNAAKEAVAVVAETLPRGGQVHLSYGDEEAAEYINQLVTDHLIHAWDLAAAIDADRTLDPELMAYVGGWFADKEELYRSGGAIADRVDGGEDPQARLLGQFGRSSTWTPS